MTIHNNSNCNFFLYKKIKSQIIGTRSELPKRYMFFLFVVCVIQVVFSFNENLPFDYDNINNPQLLFIGCTGNLAKKYIWSTLSVLHYV